MNVADEAKKLGQLWKGFWHSRVLLTANNLRVFDHLETKRSATELAVLLRTNLRATIILLDALTGLELVEKSGEKYGNTATSSTLLVSGSPFYQGDILRHADVLWKKWSALDTIVQTGLPSDLPQDYGSFILGMHNIAVLKAGEVVKELSLKGVRKALDVGGGPGTYSIELAKRVESVTLFDIPQTVSIARRVVADTKQQNVSFVEGDFLTDSLGEGYDLVFISQVLHAYSERDNRLLLDKAYRALIPGGQVVIQEFFIDKDLTTPLGSALFSVNMLVGTSGGRCYSPGEMKAWLTSSGFGALKQKKLGDTVLVFGRKA